MGNHKGFKATSAYQTILRNEQATRRNIIKQLKQLCQKVQENDRVLIYYSGHGHLDKLIKRGYWIPVDGEKEDDSTFVANSDIRDYIKAMKSRHVLLISDSCFSESLVVRNAERREQGAYEKWERSKSRWLFSSGKGVVSDGKKGENSPFAKEIVLQLSKSDVDKINIVRLADEVTKNVSFNYEQKAEASPFFATGHDGGQFIFYKIQEERIEEAVEFENVKNNKNRYEMMHFLEKSKNKEHKKVIRQMLKTIEYGDVWQKVDKNAYSSLNDFIDDFPNHSKIEVAKELRDKIKRNAGKAELQVEIEKMKMELEGMRKEDSTSKIITPISISSKILIYSPTRATVKNTKR